MAEEVWEDLVVAPDVQSVSVALERVRGRAAVRRADAVRRWRVLAIAAGIAVTFAAGFLSGRASGGGQQLSRMWALGGSSVEANRGTFTAVPVGERP
jgi:hypothetical protein